MNKNLRFVSFGVCAMALVLASQTSWANDDQAAGVEKTADAADTSPGMNTQEPGITTMPESTHPMREGQDSATQDRTDQQKVALKSEVAPHVVVIESSLESAKDQLAGIRAQYELSSNVKDQTKSLNHYQIHSREIRDDLKMAMDHQGRLQSSLKKYPEIAQSGEFKQADTSLKEVNRVAQSWESKSKTSSYWNNKDQVKQDLDNFEKQIDSAIKDTKSFGSKNEAPSVG